MYFSTYIPYFSWMVNPLFKSMQSKDLPHEWLDKHQKYFKLIKFALVSVPVHGHPEPRQTYQLYTDASDYVIAGALQQIQYIPIKDLKGTRVHEKLAAAHKKGKKVPELVSQRLVVAYWSRVLAPAKTRYSAMEREALAAKESLVCFQPFIEGERILLVTDHSALTWAKTYKNANRRLAAWGLVFATFPEMVIIHRPGQIHWNVDPLSCLPRIPSFVSPARDDLPDLLLLTKHEELQKVWSKFIRSRELVTEGKLADI